MIYIHAINIFRLSIYFLYFTRERDGFQFILTILCKHYIKFLIGIVEENQKDHLFSIEITKENQSLLILKTFQS